ncbi:MAG: sugar phosphate isomerase/epimerase [Propionibacteriaceae bacterium]|jgi:myo-inositol catabolism protein IolH|nr:sugar phosphate isomerase/epimerase [Propionibacteriaceae bacterium]
MKLLLEPALIIGQPIAASFAAAVEFGYDGVEFGNRNDAIPAYGALAMSLADLSKAGKAAALAGTVIESVAIIQSWADPDEAVRTQAVAWWRDGIEAALALGARRINTEFTGKPDQPESSRESFLRSWEEIGPVIEREGMEVRVEPHPGDFIEDTVGACALIGEVGSPALGYLHCFPHTFYLGGSIHDQLSSAGRFDHIHLADTFRPARTILNPPEPGRRIHQHFDLGRGEVDWTAAKQALALVGFDGLASVQVYCWDERAAESFAANQAAARELLADASLPEGGATQSGGRR